VKKHSVFLRADGNSIIGLGHVMRCLSLVEMLNKDFDCEFIIFEPSAAIALIIESLVNTYKLENKNDMSWLERVNRETDVVVLDGYCFKEEYQQQIKQFGIKLVMIDDNANNYYYADLIINHGSQTIISKYRTEPYSKILTGFNYLILRKVFLNEAKKQRQIDKIDTVMICMGGSDPKKLTPKFLSAVIKSKLFTKVNVLIGGANDSQFEDCLRENINISYKHNFNANEITEMILQSQIVISPASTMSLEVCAVKAGLFTGTIADNQENILRQLIDYNCCYNIGDLEQVSEENIIGALVEMANLDKINNMMRNQYINIDGNSDSRVIGAIKELLI